jgi:hypothetical protein
MEMWDDDILVLRTDLGQVLLLAHQTWHLYIFENSIVASRSASLKGTRQFCLDIN